MAKRKSAQKPKRTMVRSPNYPSVDLGYAVNKLPGLFDAMRRHSVGIENALKAMGLKFTSSTGKLALAAMRAFGLFEDDGQGMIKLSTRALDIAVGYSKGSTEWKRAVQEAALSPNIHKKLWDRYQADLPADDELRRYLVRELNFNDNSVASFIDEYKNTVAFAGLANGSLIEKNGDNDTPVNAVKIGDYVQWTHDGMEQFSEPRRVRWMSDDGNWAAVDGSDTGVSVAELDIQTPLEVKAANPVPPAVPPAPQAFQSPPLPQSPPRPQSLAAFSGPRTEFALGDGNAIEIRLKKPVSKKDFDRIVKLVQLSEDSFVEKGGDSQGDHASDSASVSAPSTATHTQPPPAA